LKTKQVLTFKVAVNPLKTVVRRKDKDFSELHMYLIKAYPNVLVASLQAFNPQKAGSAKYINKR